MRVSLVVLLFLYCLQAIAQVTPNTYLYPKPRPTSGQTPPDLSHLNVTLAPDSYVTEAPVLWSIDLGGGLHSRLNAADRLALMKQHTQEGAIVYDATEQMYYMVDNTLTAQVPLFPWNLYNIVTNLVARKTLYSGDDTIAGDRIVTARGKLSFTSDRVRDNANYTFEAKNISDLSDNLVLEGTSTLAVKTFGVKNSQVQKGWPLVLKDTITGLADYEPLTLTNIYTADGALTTDRFVDLNRHMLRFTGVNSSLSVDTSFVGISAKTNNFYGSEATILATQGDTGVMYVQPHGYLFAQLNDVLTLLDPATGRVEFRPPPTSTGGSQGPTIYNGNGALDEDRMANVNFLNLTWTNGAIITSVAKTNKIVNQTAYQLVTPKVFQGASTNGHVLTLKAIDGTAEFEPLPPQIVDTSIYTTNGTLGSDRQVLMNGKTLTFEGAGSPKFEVHGPTLLTLDGVTNKLSATQLLSLHSDGNMASDAPTNSITGNVNLRFITQKILNPLSGTAPGDALRLLNTNGTAEWAPIVATNIYNSNGTLTGDRTVTHGTNLLTFDATGGRWQVYNANSVALGANTNSIYGRDSLWLSTAAALRFTTPRVNSSQAKIGDVLTVQAITPGSDVAADFYPTTNIYTGDGILTGNRYVDLSGHDLTFNAPGSVFSVFSAREVGLSAQTNTVWGYTNMVIGSDGAFKLRTPGQIHNQVNPGMVLTMTTTDGDAEYTLPQNLYNTNGTLTGHRTVNGSFNDLAFTNIGYLSARGRTSVLSGNFELDIRTPNVSGLTAATNQVLTLLDKTTGRSEFMDLPGFTNIYVRDGAVTGNRSVTIPTDLYLRTIGPGTLILNSAVNNINAVTNYFISSDLAQISANNRLQVKSPRFWNGQAKSGDVLTMVDRETGVGAVDFYTPTNIYNNNGTITGARTIAANGAGAFTLQNFSDFNLQVVTNVLINGMNQVGIYARGQLILGTPKIFGTGGFPTAGWVLTLQDAASGRVEFAPIGGTGSGDYSSIYANDGILATNLFSTPPTRTLNINGKRLLFLDNTAMGSAGDFQISMPNGRFTTSAATNDLFSSTFFRAGGGTYTIINTPGTYSNAAARAGMFLQWDGTKNEYAPVNAGADTSIYNTNGTLSGNRILNGGNLDLTFQGIKTLDMRATNVTIGQTGGPFKLLTPTVNAGGAAIGQFLRLTATDGTVDFQTFTPDTIYSKDGTLAGTRIVSGGASKFPLQFTSMSSFDAIADTINLQASSLRIVPAGGSQAGQVLTALGTDGSAQWQTPSALATIYSQNGTITPFATTRQVSLNSSLLRFQGAGNTEFKDNGTFDVNTTTRAKISSTLEATIEGKPLKLRTPRVQGVGAPVTTAEYLKLDATDGSVEFAAAPGSVNLYNQNGTMSGVNPRHLTGAGYDLTFDGLNNLTLSGAHALLQGTTDAQVFGNTALNLTSQGLLTINSQNAQIYGSSSVTLGGANTQAVVRVKTPNVVKGGGLAKLNQVLKLKNLDGTVEFDDDLVGTGGGTVLQGIYVGPGSATGTAAAYTISITNPNPGWGTQAYIPGMRASAQVVTGITSPNSGSLQAHKFKLGGGAAEWIVGADGKSLLNNELVDRVTLDLVYVAGIANGSNAWMMVNTGWRSSGHFPATSFGDTRASATDAIPNNVYTGVGYATPFQNYERYEVVVRETSPTYTGDGITRYPHGMRVTVRFTCPTCPQGVFGNIQAAQYIQIENGPWVAIMGGDGNQLAASALFEGAVLDLIHIRDLQQTVTGRPIGDSFIPANSTGMTLGSFAFPGMNVPSTANPAQVTVVTFAGVVDTFAQLASVPTTFKKVSTLGFLRVGDGRHADYYLTDYDDRTRGRDGIRSQVDQTRMWKRLR